MRRIRFRFVLPVVFGFLALVLFAWEHQNNRVIASMGMGWDTGPPMWPYEAVPLFSYALNAPAYIACGPLIRLIDPRADWIEYAIWFPAITAMWWWVGTRIDYGLLGRRKYRRPKLVAGLLVVGALVLLVLAIRVGVGEYRLFRYYWPAQDALNVGVILLRAIGPMLWCLLFARACIRSAYHLVSCF
jgi:hypothetical protein